VSQVSRDFDLSAAWFRKAQTDIKAFMEGFVARMESALPGRVRVDRKRDGLFSSTSHAVKIEIDTGQNIYQLTLEHGRMIAHRTKAVRGVTLKSEELAVPEWLEALNHDVQHLADHADSAHGVLHDFLMS